jgi:hypothetical protein
LKSVKRSPLPDSYIHTNLKNDSLPKIKNHEGIFCRSGIGGKRGEWLVQEKPLASHHGVIGFQCFRDFYFISLYEFQKEISPRLFKKIKAKHFFKRRLEDWKIGRFKDWKIGRLEDWKIGRLEDWKIGRLED